MKSDMQNSKQSTTEIFKAKIEIDRLTHTISSMDYELASAKQRTKELEQEQELKDHQLSKLTTHNDLIAKRLRALLSDHHLDQKSNKEYLRNVQEIANRKINEHEEKLKMAIQEKIVIQLAHQRQLEELSTQHQEKLSLLTREKENELNELKNKLDQHVMWTNSLVQDKDAEVNSRKKCELALKNLENSMQKLKIELDMKEDEEFELKKELEEHKKSTQSENDLLQNDLALNKRALDKLKTDFSSLE